MRKLSKGQAPSVLREKGAEWTREFTDKAASGDRGAAPWRNPAIVTGLKLETFSKCAYCEGVIADVAYPHVDHILPKSRRPDLVVAWDNLTISCPSCNTAKGEYYEPACPLINPYCDDPLDHLVFVGPAVFPKLANEKGTRTVRRLNLMRAALVIERCRRLEALHLLLDVWMSADGADKEAVAIAIERELEDDREFVQSLRCYAHAIGFRMQDRR
jgi:uncharacterized protein (TIGR02646 family)